MAIKYSSFSPDSSADGVKGTTLPATRNVSRGEWAPATSYEVGDFVTYNGDGYITTTTHISTGSFDPTKFTIFVESGAEGPPGINSAVVFIFKRSASAPTLPSVVTTYTFTTGVLTGLNNGWTLTAPAGTDPLYVSVATAANTNATDTIAAAEWATPVILAQNGLNIATVFLYKRSVGAPTVPSVTSTYTFATGILTGHDNGWTQTVPTGTDPLYVITATASNTTATDTILTGEWAAPKVMSTSGNFLDLRFKRSATTPATPTGDSPAGWTNGVPAGLETLWASTGLKNASGVLIGTWSVPERISSLAPRGIYSGSNTYYLYDWVTYNGGSYVAVQNNFTGQTPSGTAQANAYWDVLAAPGEEGTPGDPPSGFSATINLTSGASVNLRTVANANGYTGASDATVTFKVPNGVIIRGLSGTPGGFGIDTGTWPTGSYTIALTLIIESGGIVDGGGGAGGSGNTGASGSVGGIGGDAIYIRLPLTGGITINSGGTVRGGGGGGGGGGGQTTLLRDTETGEYFPSTTRAGGVGGGGFPNGSPNGTTSGGGAGSAGESGCGAGGAGGGAAATGTGGTAGTTIIDGGPSDFLGFGGGNAGVGGFAVRKNGHTVTVTNNGTMTGTAG